MTMSTKQNRYDLMDSQQIEGDYTVWPDCLSINLDDFPDSKPRADALVCQDNVLRPDMFFYKKMGTNNLEDIVLWLNEVPSRRDLEPGMSLRLPVAADINSYFIKNRKLN
jgi:hypothetical protein